MFHLQCGVRSVKTVLLSTVIGGKISFSLNNTIFVHPFKLDYLLHFLTFVTTGLSTLEVINIKTRLPKPQGMRQFSKLWSCNTCVIVIFDKHIFLYVKLFCHFSMEKCLGNDLWIHK